MKKILSTILAVAMLVTLSSSVFANPMNESFVTYSIPDTYTVTIPETIAVGQNYDNEVIITASTNLAPERILTVRVADGVDLDGRIYLNNGYSSNAETYLFYQDSDLPETRVEYINNFIAAQFTGQNTDSRDNTRPLKVKAIDSYNKAAGTYTATIQFDISINNVV